MHRLRAYIHTVCTHTIASVCTYTHSCVCVYRRGIISCLSLEVGVHWFTGVLPSTDGHFGEGFGAGVVDVLNAGPGSTFSRFQGQHAHH